eukprot:3476940-Prymnesium_polylepis.2
MDRSPKNSTRRRRQALIVAYRLFWLGWRVEWTCLSSSTPRSREAPRRHRLARGVVVRCVTLSRTATPDPTATLVSPSTPSTGPLMGVPY